MGNLIYSQYISTATDKYCKMMEFNKYFLTASNAKIYSDRMFIFFDIIFGVNHKKTYGLRVEEGTVKLYDYNFEDTTITVTTGMTGGVFSLYASTTLSEGQLIINPTFEIAQGFYSPKNMCPFNVALEDIPNRKDSVHRDEALTNSALQQDRTYNFTYAENWSDYSTQTLTRVLKQNNVVDIFINCKNKTDTAREVDGLTILTINDSTYLPSFPISTIVEVWCTRTITETTVDEVTGEETTTERTINTFRQQGIARLSTDGVVKLYGYFNTYRRLGIHFNYLLRV